jgi:hypothetical protein
VVPRERSEFDVERVRALLDELAERLVKRDVEGGPPSEDPSPAAAASGRHLLDRLDVVGPVIGHR